MAELLWDIDTDGLGDYSSINAWEAANQQDLITAGDWAHPKTRASSGSADTSVLTISGWDTDATHNIVIEAESGDEALKTGWDAAKYRLVANSSFIIGSGEGYLSLIGLQLENTSTSGGDAVFFENVAGDFLFQNCYIRATGAASGIHMANSGADLVTENNIIVNLSSLAGSEGIFLDAVNSSLNYNNVIEGWDDGVEVDEGTNVFKNNAIFNNTTDVNDDGGTNTYDYNASDDVVGTNPQSPSDWTAVFNDYINGDFALLATNDLRDNGVGPSTDSNVPALDIDGDTRSGTTCDIGVDEYQAAPPTGIAVLRRRMEDAA